MASGTCRYSFECRPFGYSKWPSRSAPVSRSTRTTSSPVGNRCMFSVCSFAGENARNSQQQNFPIEAKRPGIDILHVHFHPLFEIHIVAAGQRPEAGEPGPHAQPSSLPTLILFHLVRDRRTRAHQRHVAFEHVPQLRPLINGEFPQNTPDGG